MGWAVLYIAFGVVALWLLGEVLLQYKARLRWRLLAFAGFLGVVLGVLIPSVVVIGLGAAAFAVGQTYVTLSFRRGFAAGWAVNAPMLAAAKGRRGDRGRQEPTLEVSGLETSGAGHGDEDDTVRDRAGHHTDDDYDRDDVFTPAARPGRPAADTTAVYEPQPIPDDTGSYGVYGDDSGYAAPSQDQYAAAPQGADPAHAYDYSGYGQQQAYDTTGQQYAAYSDPYIGNSAYGNTSYDTGYADPQQYSQQGYGQDPYAQQGYGGETPAGGLWVPQQRTADDPYGGELPPEQQQYPYQGDAQPHGNGGGYDEQYRY